MIDGFQKITLGSANTKTIIKSKIKPSGNKHYKFIGGVLLLLFLIIVIFGAAAFIPSKNLYFAVQKTTVVAGETYNAVKKQDVENAKVKLSETKENLNNVDKYLKQLAWLKFIPIVGTYQQDLQHLITGSVAGVEAGQITIDTLIPYTDLLGLKGKSSFVSGSADDRIKTAVETLDKVTSKLEDIAQKIAIADKEFDQIDPNHYPEKIGKYVVKSRLENTKAIFSQASKLFLNAQPLLSKLPELLGSKGERYYLVLFQNDAELRATGGFITAYAIFKVDKGKMQVVKADDIYKLDESKRKKFPAPTPIIKYHKDVYNFELRDSNLSPDFLVSMQEFENMLKESVPDFSKYDGIIALDTHVLAQTIKVLGEFNIYGRKFSAEIDSRCDCPRAIYELEDYSTRPVAYLREERKDIIGVLLYQIMQRALGVSPSQYWGKLFQMFLDEAAQKHVLFYFHDKLSQSGVESLNFAGRILPFDGDYLHINNVNFAGAKSNMFVKQSVKQEITVENDGTVTKTLTINYKNPAAASNCNLEAGQLCLNGILRNWLRIYVPSGSSLVEFTGSEKETTTYNELEKTVFEGFLTVKPQGSASVKVQYRLPFKVKKGDQYKLYIQKQPGTDQIEYETDYKGRKIDILPLTTDRVITFPI